MSTREAVLSRIKNGSTPRGEEPTKTTKTISVVFDGSASLISESKNEESEIPPKQETVRSLIEGLLAEGPRPYSGILAAVGGDEDALRGVIRNWPELIAYHSEGVWYWELVRDPITLAERIGIRFEAETPDEKALGKPVFQYRGHVLAWEKDTAETKVYAWCLINLFPGRPLSVDIDNTARLLHLTPREVREALSRLTKDGDLVRVQERGRELFRLNIQYGGTHE